MASIGVELFASVVLMFVVVLTMRYWVTGVAQALNFNPLGSELLTSEDPDLFPTCLATSALVGRERCASAKTRHLDLDPKCQAE